MQEVYLKHWAKKVLKGEKQQLVYVDETGFAPSAFRTHARAFRGDKVYDKISGQRRPRTSLIAGLVAGKLNAPMLFEATTNTTVFNQWLKQMLLPKINKEMTLIMDNASFHKS